MNYTFDINTNEKTYFKKHKNMFDIDLLLENSNWSKLQANYKIYVLQKFISNFKANVNLNDINNLRYIIFTNLDKIDKNYIIYNSEKGIMVEISNIVYENDIFKFIDIQDIPKYSKNKIANIYNFNKNDKKPIKLILKK